MTNEEILAIAAECGNDNDSTLPSDLEFLFAFARRIQQMQKEKDVGICDAVLNGDGNWHCLGWKYAAAIRSQSDE